MAFSTIPHGEIIMFSKIFLIGSPAKKYSVSSTGMISLGLGMIGLWHALWHNLEFYFCLNHQGL